MKCQRFGAFGDVFAGIDIEQLSPVDAPVAQYQLGHAPSINVRGHHEGQVAGSGGISGQWLKLLLRRRQGRKNGPKVKFESSHLRRLQTQAFHNHRVHLANEAQ